MQKTNNTNTLGNESLSASSAYNLIPDSLKKSNTNFSTETRFRKYLKEDAGGDNIFNVKMHVLGTQTRFIITKGDFLKGLSAIMSE